MAHTVSSRASLSHVERTGNEPRDNSLHRVILSQTDQVNEKIRLLRLTPSEGEPAITFLPGQWLDVHINGIDKVGGFTITSPPSALTPCSSLATSNGKLEAGYLELAVQSSPSNPPAAWLWRPASSIIGEELEVRVGGSFVWPPKFHGTGDIRRVLFVAGGVGINPLMSILTYLTEENRKQELGFDVSFFYTVRDPGPLRAAKEILFLERIATSIETFGKRGALNLFLTGNQGDSGSNGKDNLISLGEKKKLSFKSRRIASGDLIDALGPVEERKHTVCYICGVPAMTDGFVKVAQTAEGMDSRHVLFERWW